jgi:osmotically-inducible protein OsmY
MSTRYDDRDYDRDEQYYGQYNRRSNSEFDRSGRERRYGGRGQYQSGREDYWGRGWENERDDDTRESRYGSYGRSGAERGYSEGMREGTRNYQQRYNYPTGFRSTERYGERERGYDYGRGRSEYDRGRYDREEDRGWLDRVSDRVASWFGDEDAERRRRQDERREYRGRGPKGYRRSDERIKEDVNDRLSDDYNLDASNIEVAVENTEVVLTGTVESRYDKRRAEDVAESVSGVTNVENRLRVKQSGYGNYSSTDVGTGTGMGGNVPGQPGTTTSSAAAGGGTKNR